MIILAKDATEVSAFIEQHAINEEIIQRFKTNISGLHSYFDSIKGMENYKHNIRIVDAGDTVNLESEMTGTESGNYKAYRLEYFVGPTTDLHGVDLCFDSVKAMTQFFLSLLVIDNDENIFIISDFNGQEQIDNTGSTH